MPWDPVRDLLQMHERLESLFGQARPGWVPAVDLSELDDRYLVSMELPGLAREDVTIEFAEQVLTVRGTRPTEPSPDRYQQLERGQGPFTRAFKFALPGHRRGHHRRHRRRRPHGRCAEGRPSIAAASK